MIIIYFYVIIFLLVGDILGYYYLGNGFVTEKKLVKIEKL